MKRPADGPAVVLSDAVNSVAYDPWARVLQVQYAGGKSWVYRYHDVPPGVFQKFADAWVLGAYLNEKIKPYYRFEKLTPAEAAMRPLTHHGPEGPLMGGYTRAKRRRRFGRLGRWKGSKKERGTAGRARSRRRTSSASASSRATRDATTASATRAAG